MEYFFSYLVCGSGGNLVRRHSLLLIDNRLRDLRLRYLVK